LQRPVRKLQDVDPEAKPAPDQARAGSNNPDAAPPPNAPAPLRPLPDESAGQSSSIATPAKAGVQSLPRT